MQGGHLGYAAWMDFSVMFVTFFLHEHVPTDLSSSWIVVCGRGAEKQRIFLTGAYGGG